MTTKKTVLVEIDDTQLEQTLQALKQLPRKGRPLREVIAFLSEEIQQTLAKGYSYTELASFLGERGIAIAEHTLRQYLAEANKTKAQKKTTTKKTQPSETSKLTTVTPCDTTAIPTQFSSDTRPKRHTVGKFVEMPKEL